MAPLKSPWWSHFTRVDANSATCNACCHIIKTSGNTSNLQSHMKKKHPKLVQLSRPLSPNEPASKEPEKISKMAKFFQNTPLSSQQKHPIIPFSYLDVPKLPKNSPADRYSRSTADIGMEQSWGVEASYEEENKRSSSNAVDPLEHVGNPIILEENDIDDDVSTDDMETRTQEDRTSPQNLQAVTRQSYSRKRKLKDDLTTEFMTTVCNRFKLDQSQHDRFDLLGKTFAIKLRGLADKRQCLIAEKRIHDILFEAEMGALTCESFTPPSSQNSQNFTPIPLDKKECLSSHNSTETEANNKEEPKPDESVS